MLENLGIVLRHALGRNPRHGRDRGLDFLDADGLLALVLRHQHLRRTRLVDHVDRLVRQLAVVDVARRQLHRGLDRLVGVFQPVIVLEIGFQALEDRDRVLHRRLVDVDLLEPAHQRAVLFEMLAVFLVGGRAHAADGARCQRRLEQIGGVHRAAGRRAGADHGMDFVDEQDRVRMRLEFLEHLLQPLLEIAAIAGAREQACPCRARTRSPPPTLPALRCRRCAWPAPPRSRSCRRRLRRRTADCSSAGGTAPGWRG